MAVSKSPLFGIRRDHRALQVWKRFIKLKWPCNILITSVSVSHATNSQYCQWHTLLHLSPRLLETDMKPKCFFFLQMNWYSFLPCVSQTIFDSSPKLHLSFIGALHRELSLPLVQAEVFLCSLTVWESKSHSIYWTDHQGCPLWHVMTHMASFLLFVSVAEGNWWCCQDVLYTIKHRAERRLSASPWHEPPLSRPAILHPVLFVWPSCERKVTLILSLGLAAATFEEPVLHCLMYLGIFRHFSVQGSIWLACCMQLGHFTRHSSGLFLSKWAVFG